jgi:hypothetical protein
LNPIVENNLDIFKSIFSKRHYCCHTGRNSHNWNSIKEPQLGMFRYCPDFTKLGQISWAILPYPN